MTQNIKVVIFSMMWLFALYFAMANTWQYFGGFMPNKIQGLPYTNILLARILAYLTYFHFVHFIVLHFIKENDKATYQYGLFISFLNIFLIIFGIYYIAISPYHLVASFLDFHGACCNYFYEKNLLVFILPAYFSNVIGLQIFICLKNKIQYNLFFKHTLYNIILFLVVILLELFIYLKNNAPKDILIG